MALVLDVARFKYPPHWVAVERLWQAMQPVDAVTGRPRGFMVLRRRERGVALGFSLKCDGDSWTGLARRLEAVAGDLEDAGDLPALARAALPLTSHLELRLPTAPAHQEALAAARAALRAVPVYPLVAESVGAERAEAVTILLLAMADLVSSARRPVLHAWLSGAIDDPTLEAELSNVRAQLAALLANITRR
jgi:glutathione gamma-glutamylcysteinyltransferase